MHSIRARQGLSLIDYDAATDTWILASDDGARFDAARFYTARLAYYLQQHYAYRRLAATRLG